MRLRILSFISLLAMIACAPAREDAGVKRVRGQVGMVDPDSGAPYTTNDPRLSKALREQSPVDPTNPTAQEKQRLSFVSSLETFKLLRFDDFRMANPKRLGTKFFKFQVQQKDASSGRKVITFKGKLESAGGRSSFKNIASEKGDYTLDGELTDAPTEDAVAGKFILRQKDQSAEIQYTAHKSSMEIFTDLTKKDQSAELQSEIDSLKRAKYMWVQKMWVADAVSILRNDILEEITPGAANDIRKSSLSSFSTKSVDTGKAEKPVIGLVDKAQTKKVHIKSVALEGNATKADSQVYSVTLEDKSGKTAEVMIATDRSGSSPFNLIPEAEKIEPIQAQKPSDEPADEIFEDPVDEPSVWPSVPSSEAPAPAKPAPLPKARPTQQAQTNPAETDNSIWPTEDGAKSAPSRPNTTAPQRLRADPVAPQVSSVMYGVNSQAFIVANLRNPRTKKMSEAYAKNYNVPRVQAAYQKIKRANVMSHFFKYLYNFRPLMYAIAEIFDTSPIVFYLTAQESRGYFVNRGYKIETGDGGKAYGPFQFHAAAARQVQMTLAERGFYAPSACGGAKYITWNTDRLKGRDPTLALLGYNQGPGVVDRVTRYDNFGITYARISKTNMISHHANNYIANVLAYYFIGGEYEQYRAIAETGKNVPLPANYKPASINDPLCQKAVNQSQAYF